MNLVKKVISMASAAAVACTMATAAGSALLTRVHIREAERISLLT